MPKASPPPSVDFESYPALLSVGQISQEANWRGGNLVANVTLTLLNDGLRDLFATPPSSARVEQVVGTNTVVIFEGVIDSIRMSQFVEIGLIL